MKVKIRVSRDAVEAVEIGAAMVVFAGCFLALFSHLVLGFSWV